jgi:hypothetical protein
MYSKGEGTFGAFSVLLLSQTELACHTQPVCCCLNSDFLGVSL